MNKKAVFLIAACFAMPISAASADPSAGSGKAIFTSKCVVCHSIGAGKIVGPDLKGVTARREKSWLLGYIKDPDKYLQFDATAQSLLKEYMIPMPNPALSEAEVADVVAYLEQQK